MQRGYVFSKELFKTIDRDIDPLDLFETASTDKEIQYTLYNTVVVETGD